MSELIDRISNEIDKVNNKLDQIIDKQYSIDKTLVKQEASLSEHIRRTDLLEKKIEMTDNDLRPVIRHVNGMKFLGKSLVVLSLIIGIILGMVKLISML